MTVINLFSSVYRNYQEKVNTKNEEISIKFFSGLKSNTYFCV